MAISNYDAAMKAEAKKVIRQFHHLSSEQVSTLASHRSTARSRICVDRGEFFYTHPGLPGICFPKRFAAAREYLRRQNT